MHQSAPEKRSSPIPKHNLHNVAFFNIKSGKLLLSVEISDFDHKEWRESD